MTRPGAATVTVEKIIRALEEVADDPGSARLKQRNGRTRVSGTRDGIAVDVIVAPNGEIVTGYPVRVPRGP